MLLEETPSGNNLRLYPAGKPEAAVKLSRADVRAFAEFFKLLDAWDREAAEDAKKERP